MMKAVGLQKTFSARLSLHRVYNYIHSLGVSKLRFDIQLTREQKLIIPTPTLRVDERKACNKNDFSYRWRDIKRSSNFLSCICCRSGV